LAPEANLVKCFSFVNGVSNHALVIIISCGYPKSLRVRIELQRVNMPDFTGFKPIYNFPIFTIIHTPIYKHWASFQIAEIFPIIKGTIVILCHAFWHTPAPLSYPEIAKPVNLPKSIATIGTAPNNPSRKGQNSSGSKRKDVTKLIILR